MPAKIKRFFGSYKRGFWMLAAVITLFSTVIYGVTNFSGVPARIAADAAEAESREVAEYLDDAEEAFSLCANIIDTLSTQSQDVDHLAQEMNVVVDEFMHSRSTVAGYFYKLNTDLPDSRYEIYYDHRNDKTYHISVLSDAASLSGGNSVESRASEASAPFWASLYNYMTGEMYLSYIVPLFRDEDYLGFCGVNIDLDYLRTRFFLENTPTQYGMLLSDDLQIIVHPYADTGVYLPTAEPGLFKNFTAEDGFNTRRVHNHRFWLLTATRLPSGQIYVTAAQTSAFMHQANMLILLITFLALFCLFLVQKNVHTGYTFFDRFTEFFLRTSSMTLPHKNRHRAALALYMSMTLSMLAYFLYTGSFLYLGLFAALAAVFGAYIRFPFKKRMTVFLAGTILTLPVAAHLIMGGFSASGMGLVLVWAAVAFAVALFLFDARVADAVFSVYVLYLFADVLVEIYIFKYTDYHHIFLMISTLFFLGYAFFTAFGVFLSRSEKDYNDIDALLRQLRETQSLMVQREKMTTLGNLIAGIAHEINTPLGAVKATAENLDASVQPLVETLLLYSRDMDEEDYYSLLMLIGESRRAVAEMKSTLETRREKARLREFLRQNSFENADELTERLSRLDITGSDWAEANAGLLRGKNIGKILFVAEALFPVVTGTNTITFATGRIMRIVSALRSYVHTQRGVGPVSIAQSIENVLCLYDYQLRGKIEVVCTFEEDLPEVVGNADELGQVWTNLIQNAIYAMDKSGTLTITTARAFPYVSVTFRDTGGGIDKDQLSQLFDPFYTTKPVGEGSGLGLDICKKIVNDHKGEISVESEPGKGAAFTVKLPSRIPEDQA